MKPPSLPDVAACGILPALGKPVVIVNPRSGGGISEKRWASVVGALTDGLGVFDTRFTEAPGHARAIAHDEAQAGRTLVVAMGGDGTISEVADGLVAAGGTAEMGIIPRGTGGDFRRTLGIEKEVSAAAARVRKSPARPVDVGCVSYVAHGGEKVSRHFINVASFGFSSVVAERANDSSKRLGGRASFLSAVVRSILSYDNAEVTVSVDGGEARRMTLLLAAVGNGRFFGGGMKICPEAKLDDGSFDLVAVGDLGRLEVLAKIHRIYSGDHLSMKEVRSVRCRSLRVAPAVPGERIPVEIDGETPGHLPANFEIRQGALRLRS
ncbi:MAG: diacylglycerol kinase family lipid kinase [Deltaproteobacteria bacterium]|nr:diacylglycerol kinase family lipid kinase [Deltaproteobacteria bacterium]